MRIKQLLGNYSNYILLGTMPAYDGNLLASAAAGLFVDVFSAILFGVLCFSGVGCIVALMSDRRGSLREKVAAILTVRLLTLLLSIPGILVGVAIGGISFSAARCIAAGVIFTVGLCISGKFHLPSFNFSLGGRKVKFEAPLLVLLASVAFFIPLEFITGNLNMSRTQVRMTAIQPSFIGLLIAVLAAVFLEFIVACSSVAIDKITNLNALKINGCIALTLLSLSITGIIPFLSSTIVLIVFVAGVILTALATRFEHKCDVKLPQAFSFKKSTGRSSTEERAAVEMPDGRFNLATARTSRNRMVGGSTPPGPTLSQEEK